MHYAVLNPEDISISGLASSAFARHYLRNLGWFLFLALLRCFSSGGSPHIPILFSIWCTRFACTDCSIRISADHYMLAIPRSFSQLTTSFVGSQCQGILPTLFALYHLNYVLLFSPYKIVTQLFKNKLVVFLICIYFSSLFNFQVPHTLTRA